jgi:hypothetical protein
VWPIHCYGGRQSTATAVKSRFYLLYFICLLPDGSVTSGLIFTGCTATDMDCFYHISAISFIFIKFMFHYNNLRTGSAVRLHNRREIYNKEEDKEEEEVVLARRGVPGGCLRLLRSDRPNTAAHGTAPHAYMGHHTCNMSKWLGS